MEIKRTKTFDITKLFNINFKKKYPILSSAFIAVGITVGVILQSVQDSTQSEIETLFKKFFTENSDRSFFEIFLSDFALNTLITVILVFLGFSAIGAYFVYAVPFFKGLGVGAVCGYIYSAYLLKGVIYCTLLIFPSAIVGFIAIILACNESIQMSHDILLMIKSNGDTEVKVQTKQFALRYAVISATVALSSLMYSIGCGIFFRFV